MSTRTRWTAVIALAAVFATAGAARAADEPVAPRFRIFMDGQPGMIVKMALEGAVQRLANQSCRRVFDDFADVSGHTLTQNLSATGRSPEQALASLYFVEGDGTPQCRSAAAVALFTETGSHVIHVCGSRFAKIGVGRRYAEMLVIHELLHALGLGENPPTTTQITDTVVHRCS